MYLPVLANESSKIKYEYYSELGVIHISVNGTPVAEITDMYYTDRELGITHSGNIYSNKGAIIDFYVDNIKTLRTRKELSEFVVPEPDKNLKLDFENYNAGDKEVDGVYYENTFTNIFEVKDLDGNNVFHFADTDNATSAPGLRFDYSSTDGDEPINSYIFEFDYYFVSADQANRYLGIDLRNGSKRMFKTNMYFGEADGSSTYNVTFKNESQAATEFASVQIGEAASANVGWNKLRIEVQIGEAASANVGWNKLRIEYYPADDGNGKLLIYFNGEFVGEQTQYYTADGASLGVNRAYFTTSKAEKAEFYFDNIKLEKSSVTYEEIKETLPKPDEGGSPDDGGDSGSDTPSVSTDILYDFEDCTAGATTVDGVVFDKNSGDTNIFEVLEVDGNNLLHFADSTTESGAPSVRFSWSESGNGISYIFEFDYYLNSADKAGRYLGVDIRSGTSSASRLFKNNITFSSVSSSSAYTVSFASESASGVFASAEAVGTAMANAGWNTVRYEYYPAESKLLVYLNSLYVGEQTQYFNSSGATAAPANVYFNTSKGETIDLYFDNVKLQKSAVTYSEAKNSINNGSGGGTTTPEPENPNPENPGEEEKTPGDGEGNFDDNGWNESRQ